MMWTETRRNGRPVWCDGCGSPDALLYYRGTDGYCEFLCDKCATMYQRADLAAEHFEAYIEPALKVWVEHWQARGLLAIEVEELTVSGLRDALRALGIPEQIEARRAERLEAREGETA